MSVSARVLIGRLLRRDPAARYGALQALVFPWVTGLAAGGPTACAEGLLAQAPRQAEADALREALLATDPGLLLTFGELAEVLAQVRLACDKTAGQRLSAKAASGNGLVDCTALMATRRWSPLSAVEMGAEALARDFLGVGDLSGAFGRVGEGLGLGLARKPRLVCV